MPRLTDKNVIRTRLRRDPAWSVYSRPCMPTERPPRIARFLLSPRWWRLGGSHASHSTLFAILTGVLTIVVASAGASFAQPGSRNIVMIVGDDMGYADIGVHGSKDIPTPNIDALARAGTRFTDAYVTGPTAARREPDC
jgi:hypothetical protein